VILNPCPDHHLSFNRPRLRESPESTEPLFVMADQPKMQPTGVDVEAFLEATSNVTRRADARALCVLFSEITGEPPVLWGASIVGFGSYHYRYESGHEGNAPLASFASRGAHLAIYLVGGFTDRHERLLQRLGPHKAGKGCLYIKSLADIDLDVLRQLVARSMKVHCGQHRASRAD
jgi:hypothetical protein